MLKNRRFCIVYILTNIYSIKYNNNKYELTWNYN